MISIAGFLWVGWLSTGMPRPLSETVTLAPSLWRVPSIWSAWPFMASSTELSKISQTRWWSPDEPVPPMYMPGRLRTGSRPSRTVMLLALYWVEVILSLSFRSRICRGRQSIRLVTRPSLRRRFLVVRDCPAERGREGERRRVLHDAEHAGDEAHVMVRLRVRVEYLYGRARDAGRDLPEVWAVEMRALAPVFVVLGRHCIAVLVQP